MPAYAQTIQYNPFGDMTLRGTGVWGNSAGFTATYLNGRKQNTDLIYDAAGNLVENPTINPNIYDKWKFDAAGRVVETVSRWYEGAPQQTSFDRTHEVEQVFDGAGQIVKRTETKTSVQIFPSNTHVEEKIEYFVRSSVLGGKILTELKPDGTKKLTNVYAGKGIIAEQLVSSTGSTVTWRHEDLVTGSFQKVTQNGTPHQYGDPENAAEFEPLGGVIPDTDPNPEEPDVSPFPDYRWSSDIERPERGCSWDGTPVDCSMLSHILRGNQVSRIEVNIRAEGGWNAYYGLRSSISVWHYRKFRIDPSGMESRDFDGDDGGGVIRVEDNTHLVAEWFEILIDPIWQQYFNLVDSGNQKVLKFKDRAKTALGKLMELNKGKCGEMLRKLFTELGNTSPLRTDKFDDLYDKIDHFIFNTNESGFQDYVTGNRPTYVAGGGLSYATTMDGRWLERGTIAFVAPFDRSYGARVEYRATKSQIRTVMKERHLNALQWNFIRLVHEMFHVASKGRTFDHNQLGAAALAADPELKVVEAKMP